MPLQVKAMVTFLEKIAVMIVDKVMVAMVRTKTLYQIFVSSSSMEKLVFFLILSMGIASRHCW